MVILYLFYNSGLLEVASATAKEMALGFIDDVVFLAAGPDLESTHRKVADMMERPNGGMHWSATHSSLFKPDKFHLVDFTHKRESSRQPGQKITPIAHPVLSLGTQKISPVQSYKYLGVILDQELRFKEHVAYALAKDTSWVTQFCRLSRPTVGMPPRYARQLYKGIAVPRMLYAADIFLTPIVNRQGRKKTLGSIGHISKLARVQRMAGLHITGAMCSTASDMLDAHDDLLPFHILVNHICQRSALRLAAVPDTHPLHKPVRRARRYIKHHRAPLHELLHAFGINPEALETIATHQQTLSWIRHIEVRKAANKDEAYREEMESRMQIKDMDGSDKAGCVGTAAIHRNGQRQGTLRVHLGSSSLHTIYKAELAGILLATHQLKGESHWHEAEIGLDSQVAIDALSLTKPMPSHYLVNEIHKQLCMVRNEHPTTMLMVC